MERRWLAWPALVGGQRVSAPGDAPRQCQVLRCLPSGDDRGRARDRRRDHALRNIARRFAQREVIIAASSINSPKLLGCWGKPGAHLAEHGIPVLADRPGWGRTCRTIWSSSR